VVHWRQGFAKTHGNLNLIAIHLSPPRRLLRNGAELPHSTTPHEGWLRYESRLSNDGNKGISCKGILWENVSR
jgi:hypothetical protein